MSQQQQQWFQLQDTFRSVICQYASPIDLYHLALTCQACYFACSDASIWKVHIFNQFRWWRLTMKDLDQLEQDIIIHSHPSMMSIFIKLVTMKEKSFKLTAKSEKSNRKEVKIMRECVRFLVGSSVGWTVAEGFCSQLIHGYYNEDYDPCLTDIHKKDMNGIPISLYSVSMNEEYESLNIHYLKDADSFLYMIKLRDHLMQSDLQDISSHLYPLQTLASLAMEHEIVIQFMVGVCWEGGAMDAVTKRKTLEFIRNSLVVKVPVVDVMECSLHSREEVEGLVNRALLFVELFDWKVFIKTLPSIKPLRKKPCLCM